MLPDDQPPTAPPLPLPPVSGPTRKGKVARLPKRVRDKLNIMLLDGLKYTDVIQNLGPEAQDLNEDNISRWKAGGYQDWLRGQQRLEAMRAKQEFAADLFLDQDASKIHQATLQVAATNLCELLVDLDPAELREMLQKEPDKYTRLLNAIARLSDGEIRYERHRAQEAERQARIQKANTPIEKRGITAEALAKAEAKLNLM